jgi:hypothetical protein
MADDKGDNKIRLILGILVLIGVIITAFATIIAPNLPFIYEKIYGQEQLTAGNIFYSDFHEMNAKERNLFGACVALKDSIEAAKKKIPTGIKVGRNALNASNESIEGGEIEFGNNSKIGNVSLKVSRSAGVNLTGDGTFIITPGTPVVQGISDNNPDHNYATWFWWVEPLKEGSHTLLLTAYAVDDNGKRTPFDVEQIPIKVIVIPAPPTRAVPAANVTAPAAAPAANVTKNVTAPAKPATENVSKPANATAPAATKTPGFEGILAITGLTAVAYLVLRRKH